MRELTVTFVVDDVDADLLNNVYAKLMVKDKGQYKALHNVVAERMGISGDTIDHKNRIETDCTRHNLRSATYSQNSQNRNIKSNNTSGYIGVSWHKRNQKWQARISIVGIKRHIGYYDTPEEAAIAYDNKARDRGEFAVLNFPS